MDPDSGVEPQKAVSLQWKSYKLVQDPAIRRDTQKIYRYDGVHFSVPDSGFNPVGELRDPRPRRLWSRYTELSLPVPKFKLDEFYVGPIPLKEVTFARLNDNIKEPFLTEMCAKFGEVEEMEILFHPKTKKHLGLARVLFTSTRGAKDTVKHLHNTSVMGNIIHAQLDIKGQQRHKYYDLIVNGSYTPQTVPLGGKALTDRLQPQTPAQPDTSSDIRRRLSNELAVLAAGVQALTSGNVTPCSVDTSYSDRLDTPPSTMAGPYTPGSSTSSQGGGTPCSSRSGTPFSQDSGYSGARHTVFNTGTLASSYPPQEMLPSSSTSSVVSSTVGGYKVSRYSEDAQEASVYHRGQPMYSLKTSFRPNEPSCYPPYHGIGGPGTHMMHHSSMPPPPIGTQYDQPSMSERDRERDRDLSGRYGTGAVGSRRSSYHHQQDTNSSSKYHSHHSHHHSDRRDDRGYRRDSVGSRSGDHQRHRNHHHSHNHHSSNRRRSSHDRDRDRDRDRDGDYLNSSDPRYNSGSYRSSSNSMSPPPSSYSAYAAKESVPAPPQGLDGSSCLGAPVEKGSLPRVAVDKDYHATHHSVVPPPPPAPPPLPPASVIAAAVAETLGTLDFNQDSPAREDQWSKSKRRPSTPPAPPKTPPPSSPPQPSITSSSASPSSTSLPHHLPSSSSSHPPPKRDSSPEPDSTNESLPFVYHSSSLDSRIEMLLKEQKAKFSFLASDEEDEDRKEAKQKGALRSRGEQKSMAASTKGGRTSVNHTGDIVGKDHKKKVDREDQRGRKEANVEEGRKSPTGITTSTPSSSTYSPQIRPLEDTQNLAGLAVSGTLQNESSQVGSADIPIRTGAHTPPYNGQSQSSPHSSGEDMDISEEEEVETTITAVTTHQPSASSASPSSSQVAPPSQAADPSSSPSPITDSAQHFNTSLHPPIPSYPPHLPPPPPPGYSLQPPPPPGIPPLPHLELHPEYPPQVPHHMYDYASSMELMNQYSGGAPMSFQMQTHMLSRIHQLRMASSNGTTGPGEAATADYTSYHVHSMPLPHTHHPYMDQEGSSTGAHFDQNHSYMPPHMPFVYPDPHGTQIPPPPHHGIPHPHTDWSPHVLPPHYPSYMLPPSYGTMMPGNGGEYRAAGEEMPMLVENPHEATVQMVLATLIQEMKNIMQRDLNRKMVENVAFATFDEWWDRKETKAKPFQTMVRGLSALRDDDKKEEKVSRPREPLMSLVDWAKSGGMEGFSLRGALRLPSFKVKRKEPQEMEEVDMKRPRPSTPPDEDDEAAERRLPEAERRRVQRDNKRRKKKLRNRKPWELDSEGEETSDGSSTEKDKNEEESEKESDDDASSIDSDDESLSSSSEGSSSSESSSSSSSENEDEEDGERVESEGPETVDESTVDSTILDQEKDDKENTAAAAPKTAIKIGEDKDTADVSTPSKRPPSPPRSSSPVVLVPPLKKRRKTVSFSTEENDSKAPPPTVSQSPSPSQVVGDSPLLSSSRPPDSPVLAAPTPPARSIQGIQLLPFASKPGEASALIVPPFGRTHEPDENRKTQGASVSPQTTTVKSPSKRGAVKDSPRSHAPPVMVCLTVQNLPLDHASMCRMAFEEAPPPMTVKRARGRPRTTSLSASYRHSLREDDEDENESEQKLRLREQVGASSLLQLATAPAADLSVLADVALKMDPEAGDSEETETSDEAEEQKMDDLFSPEMLALVMSPEGVVVLMEHNYCKPPVIPVPSSTKRTSAKQDPAASLPGDLNTISGVLEAPEEVIGEMLPSRGDTREYLSTADELHELDVPSSKRSVFVKGVELEKDQNRKRNRSDKQNLEVLYVKKQKDQPTKMKRKKQKQKLEDSDLDEDVDVEELESGELSSSDTEVVEEVRKSERLFLQEAGVTSSQRWPKPEPAPAPVPVKFDNRTEFEQMTILYDIWNSGLDGEDLTLLRKTYEKLLQDDHSSDWLNDTHWVNHTITNLPNARRKRKNADTQLREHLTGCARSEGYYAISRKEKDVYLDLDLPEQVIREVENVDTTGTNRLLSERRSEQRRLLTVIGTPAVMDSDLLKLNQLKFRKKKLRFGRSRIHEWGLFAMEPIAADEMVIEYVGQNIRQMVADNREKRYAQQGIGSSYLFRVDHDTIIDATKCGNLARFINHCCTPNCYAKVITIESQKKIVIYSKQPIAVNEEITYDYKFPLEENKIPCLCGTENCRGTLN
ncbi:histone-lysine N-methyltransferase SETD1A [Thalassophryne amazonica]|uniref:histone-lysine N-methyltransferase SETD1A n=1 Tax=Thalassophryne amazonica TaxID=390379 RepID=UPI0014726B87|nr:histone-lysine N-methyltransferase SETD1A [Thalassophryne amazonica]